MTYFIQVLIDAISLGSLYALVALAIGLVFGVMRLINFAQADYITIGAYSLVIPTASITPPLLLGALPAVAMVISVVAVVTVLALLTERLAFRPLRSSDPTTLLISSFAVSYFLQSLIILVHGGRPKTVSIGDSLTGAVEMLGVRIPGVQLLTMAVALTLLICLVLFLKKTPMGVQLRAAAEDFQMARLLGVPANKVIAIAFAISGLLGGTISLLFVVQTGTLDIKIGMMPTVYAFFATVIGGIGSLPGAVLGGYIVGIISVLLQSYLPEEMRAFRDAGVFSLVILILLMRPQGLLATKASKERV
ncbi:branched-chain amino acid ABC transporter permease [Sinorhizobium meliloti]|jgi:branched-chain amino acid transport system permease protein|uniref:branched-chain amino acid ABC transporter permease n=1 Tax=Rhizobium meliloti TaxID=382 RepID=UPI00028619D7|nr:branched-chain amino acid ABC transporter permease [Sinorhizobium meliloti]CCM69639.1 putative membrane protein [Sinorhizobium meliloti Rm41]ASP83117.1 branched-chain amino acid ABC transporter permease [Sinorhizobium meliloti]MQV24915.1 branched-chain amino acid ABC transporter permease [Sinorhizobium meliloti]MQV37415.1 branched-chain amino acid ABC transporter permease [Sinorhizobium meliloti]MQW20092.1 branched-chain amino acid ABC transporter permease [Sinorhizobium meliloti]